MNEKLLVPCTGCNYCMPCPAGVDIPTCFSCYNNRVIAGKMRAFQDYLMQTSLKNETHNASKCIGCGKCEMHCPQKIEIRKELKTVARTMEPLLLPSIRFTAQANSAILICSLRNLLISV